MTVPFAGIGPPLPKLVVKVFLEIGILAKFAVHASKNLGANSGLERVSALVRSQAAPEKLH